MFTEEMEMGAEDPNKDMKIKLLDDLVERIMSMEEAPESPEVDLSTEISQEDDSEMKDKLAQMKGI